jgi:hypothetical protein
LHTTLPNLSAEQIAFTSHVFSSGGVDVSNLLEIPSYGPSFLSLWAEAKKQRLSDEDAMESVWQWGRSLPARWERENERKASDLPAVEPKVKARLEQVVAWRQTGDSYIPWDSEVDGHRWQVRLNDFPDEPMYTLLMDDAEVGDFNEWPQAWDRGEAKPEMKKRELAVAARAIPNIEATTLLSRYRNREYQSVWRDLVALGPDVRRASYKEGAQAVAQETMRRAGHNIKLLVKRLKELEYRFARPPLRPPTQKERKLLTAAEQADLRIPLSLRAFLEEVGMVCLMGSHPVLSPMGDHGEPLFLTDPLEFTSEWNLEEVLEAWSDASPDDRGPIPWEISADAQTKADILTGEQAEDFYTVQLPNAAADAGLEGEVHNITFVEYLRLSFQWGGFPGWEKYEDRPEKELAFLREGLLPL